MPYVGGKSQSGVWQRIVNLIPPHEVYVEPFFGSGAIFRLKKPAAKSIGLDLGTPPDLALLDRADLEFRQSCGIEFLETYPFTGKEFVYADPPYLMETRRSGRLYKFEMTRADHERLLRVLVRLPCPVLVSGYVSGLYAAALDGWGRDAFEVMTRGHTWATEVLWFNYPRPTILHDVGHVGADYRERWRIEKRRRRWRARLEKLPPLERATPKPARRAGQGAPPEAALSDLGAPFLAFLPAPAGSAETGGAGLLCRSVPENGQRRALAAL